MLCDLVHFKQGRFNVVKILVIAPPLPCIIFQPKSISCRQNLSLFLFFLFHSEIIYLWKDGVWKFLNLIHLAQWWNRPCTIYREWPKQLNSLSLWPTYFTKKNLWNSDDIRICDFTCPPDLIIADTKNQTNAQFNFDAMLNRLNCILCQFCRTLKKVVLFFLLYWKSNTRFFTRPL